ncbi:tryptophanase [Ktedonospora formicarum]|uniref:Tryptophanase n=1 Tax=Ktedonospora formicarum TaxID=2778364 RepID=A0A8J3I1D8_9CHLR|nr:tryptophanase [Ktedonospora formicarum]GHO47001.1 tryptophanase [Ktedonospora formicarum]
MEILDFQPKSWVEPFRIKTIAPLRKISYEERLSALERASYNLFMLRSEDVFIDLLSDSGTSAMSENQWSAMMRGDESYAGSSSFYRFEKSVKDITRFMHIIPTHQGRSAEHILFSTICKPGDVIPNNFHFDTTQANVESSGGDPLNLAISEANYPHLEHPFKGNIDLERLQQTLEEVGTEQIPCVMLTVTNNAVGGQPVSMANIRAVSALCRSYGVPFFLDACRFAENAWFIKQREDGYADRTPLEIAQEMFQYADGCTMSAKKDGLTNIGGFLALNDTELAEKCKQKLILIEGFPTYGGLAGYDMEAIAVGLQEVLQEDYLRYRVESVATLGQKLLDADIPIVRPVGGHAIFVDASTMLPHIPQHQYPAQALGIALYLSAGIRTVELGSVAFARKDSEGREQAAPLELLRLALPRRVYTRSHLDYIADALIHLKHNAAHIQGVRITWEPEQLRHFTARYALCLPSNTEV